MKNRDKILKKITTNNKLLFFLSNLNYISLLLFYYINNFKNHWEMFYYEVFIISGLFFVINSFIYFIIYKILKCHQKTFWLIFFITPFYCFKLNIFLIIIIILILIFVVCLLKKHVKYSIDTAVGLQLFISIALFLNNFIIASYDAIYLAIKSEEYNNDVIINVNDDLPTPNIYWIHCDGMISIDTVNKFFNYKNDYLNDYFEENNYFINNNANLVAAHKTQMALVALFNPNYYDNFFGNYLYNLEETFIDSNKRTDYIVNYYELEKNRLNNELFNALKEKNYTTVGIAEFDQYSSLYTDYYYNIENFNATISNSEIKNGLKSINDNNKMKHSQIRLSHLKYILNHTLFHFFVNDINLLNYDIIDYSDVDTSKYTTIASSSYWSAKAILKSIDLTNDLDTNKFVFIDYFLNHAPLTFDINGNMISNENSLNINYYLGNYIYASKILVELLEYIKVNDENAIIIVQGDHGPHIFGDDHLIDSLGIDMYGVQELKNSVINAVYIPEQFINGDEQYLSEPLNISRYLVNNFVGQNYNYIEK